MRKLLLTTLFAFIAIMTPVSAQGTDLVIIENAATGTAMASYKVDKDGRRISNSYSGDIVIPEKSTSGYPVTAINHQTFEGCVSLTSVTIPSSVKFIDYDAFRNSSLTEISIPASVDSISEGVFFGMNQLKKVTFEDGPEVLRFACGQQYGGEGQFSYKHQPIEEAYIGRTYTTIWGQNGNLDSPLFKSNETLKKVTFGNHVKKINERDFLSCKALETVVFGSGIETIGKEAFNGCSNLTAINLADGVKLIESSAFYNCSAAKTLILSKTLKEISGGAFENCKSVAELTIPASVDTVGQKAFFGMGQLKKVTIEDGPSVLRFGPGQEYGGEGHFSFKHQAIEEAYIGRAYTTTWGQNGNLDAPLFKSNETLKKVTFGNYVKNIYERDFLSCKALEIVVFGNGIETIGKEAFSNCSSLSAINLPNSVKLIESNAFKGCAAAKTLILSNSLEKISWGAFENCKSVAEMTIPASVVTVEERAFIGMDGLTKVTIADGTTTIDISYSKSYGGENMFYRQPITEAYVGRNFTSPSGLFDGNSTLLKITFGDACTEVPDKTMRNCPELTSVSLGKNISRIGKRAFENCKKLPIESLYSYNTLKTIDERAFYGCEAFLSFNLGRHPIEEIGTDAFAYCKNMAKISLPATLKNIGSGGFYKCTALTSITCLATVPPTCAKDNVFYSLDTKKCTLYVPETSINAYKAAFVWKEFFNIETGFNSIENKAFVTTDSYSINGQRTNSNHRGLTIQRTSNGQTRKVITK